MSSVQKETVSFLVCSCLIFSVLAVLVTCTVVGITGYNNLKELTSPDIGPVMILLAFYSILTAVLSGMVLICFLLLTCACITSIVDNVYKDAVEKVSEEMVSQTGIFSKYSDESLLGSSLEGDITK